MNTQKNRAPIYAITHKSGVGTYICSSKWLAKVYGKLTIAEGYIHDAVTFKDRDECKKYLNETAIKLAKELDLNHVGLDIVDIANDPLQQNETKRLRWKRNLEHLKQHNIEFRWSCPDLIDGKYLDPVDHHTCFIYDGVIVFYPTTGKWRFENQTYHGWPKLLRQLKKLGLVNA